MNICRNTDINNSWLCSSHGLWQRACTCNRHRRFRSEACRRQNAMNAKSDVLSAVQNCLCGKRRLLVELIFNYWRNSLFSSEDTDNTFFRNVCAFLTENRSSHCGRHRCSNLTSVSGNQLCYMRGHLTKSDLRSR